MNGQGKQIAETIALQMGGVGRLKCMVGAKYFAYDEKGSLTFKFMGSKIATHVKIELNGLDLYDVTFYKVRGTTIKEVKKAESIYNDMLIPCFEQTTKLYLSL